MEYIYDLNLYVNDPRDNSVLWINKDHLNPKSVKDNIKDVVSDFFK